MASSTVKARVSKSSDNDDKPSVLAIIGIAVAVSLLVLSYVVFKLSKFYDRSQHNGNSDGVNITVVEYNEIKNSLIGVMTYLSVSIPMALYLLF
jgi:hypothetical protein